MWTIVVGGGHGARFGAPKQYELLGGRRVIDVAVEAAASACDGVVVVVPAADADARARRRRWADAQRVGARRAGGGARRGRRSSACTTPLVRWPRPALYGAVVDAVSRRRRRRPCPAVAGDRHDQGRRRRRAWSSRRRTGRTLVAVQTPQAFRADVLRRAHAGAATATDDAALVEALGGRVVVVPASRRTARSPSPTTSTGPAGGCAERERRERRRPASIRVGQGFDVHRFSDDPARLLVLGGCVFAGGAASRPQRRRRGRPRRRRALLGAAGLGDIGEHFPDTDRAWAGADSIALLAATSRRRARRRVAVGNIDCAVVCERAEAGAAARRDAGTPDAPPSARRCR